MFAKLIFSFNILTSIVMNFYFHIHIILFTFLLSCIQIFKVLQL